MPRVEILLDEGDAIAVRRNGDRVWLRTQFWEQVLTREQAWELSEALDAIATGADQDPN